MAEDKTTAKLQKEIEELKAALKEKETAKNDKTAKISANEEYMKQPVTIKLFKDNG